MNMGLVVKTLREQWLATLLFAVGLGAVEALLAYLSMISFQDLSAQWLQMALVRDILRSLLGAEIGDAIGPVALASLVWVHPIVLALVWAQGILFFTRMPAAEIDQGTIDVLLGLPVSRSRLYMSESLVGLLSGMALLSSALLGNIVGSRLLTPELRPPVDRIVIVAVNLYGLYVAVAGMACLASACSDRRGRAAGCVFAVVLASFLLHSLAQFRESLRGLSRLSVLHYYRPLLILRDAAWPTFDLTVLLSIGATCWLAGAWIFARRDIRTV